MDTLRPFERVGETRRTLEGNEIETISSVVVGRVPNFLNDIRVMNLVMTYIILELFTIDNSSENTLPPHSPPEGTPPLVIRLQTITCSMCFSHEEVKRFSLLSGVREQFLYLRAQGADL